MTDILIRNVPDEEVALIDERASRLGLSRSEYLRRQIAKEASLGRESVQVSHFAKLADLADDDVMRGAWS